jgi:PhnO protein
MNKQILIRRAEDIDQKSVYQFIGELEDTVFDEKLFNSYYLENIHRLRNIYLVAEEIETMKIIGYLSCHGQLLLHHLGMVYEIQEMFVDTSYRNQGIGKLLLNKLKEVLPDNCVSLEVTAQNKRFETHEFYQANGFSNSHLKFTQSL